MTQAIGYVRRSSKDSGGHVSREEQEQAIAQLAAQHDVAIGETFIDWGRSGGDYKPRAGEDIDSDALTHRPGFRGLLRAIEDGRVSHVFAVRIDRLGRSQNALGRLWDACRRRDVKVVTTEGDMNDANNPATVLLRGMLGVFAEYYLAEQVRKNARALAYCRARGDDFGTPRYGYAKRTPKRDGSERVEMVQADPDCIAAVLAAYGESGHNYRQAARILNESDTKPPRKGKWYATSVSAVVKRHAPERAKQAQERRARTTQPRRFRGLLKCHCGSTMTPQHSSRSLGYVCPQGHHDARHPRPIVVSEAKLLPWIKDEAARLRVPYDVAEMPAGDAPSDEADRATLAAMRERIGETAYLASIAALDAARDAHGQRMSKLVAIPPSIDWEGWTVEAVNTALRALWEHVQLGPDLLPLPYPDGFAWTMPEWRAA